MGNAIGMIELSSIAEGINTADAMVKAANVELIHASTICPGKYITIVHGEVGAVRAAMSAGQTAAGHYVVDELLIPNIDPQICPAIMMTTRPGEIEAVGVMEYFSVASAITAADIAAKAANVRLIEIRIGFAIGGKGFVTLTGDVGSVRAAVAAATKEEALLVSKTVIPRPSKQLFEKLI
ncbi:MAG: BMC domain-containing protein [Cloacibacillus porcorum]|uniref:BMC domain-containing protein n=1 Tax=Cloacibacillus porcorum TaxID=1197717 RepID=UPI0023F451FE|nr:BMC domain-containing protein [Cloacibacillus porcorum]MCD7875843.1 BMC domain-containing protein [Cloacibacillus porcorum]